MKTLLRLSLTAALMTLLAACAVPKALDIPLATKPADAVATSLPPEETAVPSASPTSTPVPTPPVYDGTKLMPQFADGLTDAERDAARQLDIAVESGESKLALPALADGDAYVRAWYALVASNPVLSLCETDFRDGIVTLTYPDGADAHAANVAAWHGKVEEILAACIRGSDTETAFALYEYLTVHTTYAYDTIGDVGKMLSLSGYDVLMRGTGVCIDYARAYHFLLLQCGIPCLEIWDDGIDAYWESEDPLEKNFGNAHTWSMVKLGGAWYHVDVTFESSDYAAAADSRYVIGRYFGMSDEQRRFSRDTVWRIPTGQYIEMREDAPACPESLYLSE